MQSHSPVSLTSNQMLAVTMAAKSLPVEKRAAFLERVFGTLARPEAVRYRHPSNQDVQDAVQQALASLVARRVA